MWRQTPGQQCCCLSCEQRRRPQQVQRALAPEVRGLACHCQACTCPEICVGAWHYFAIRRVVRLYKSLHKPILTGCRSQAAACAPLTASSQKHPAAAAAGHTGPAVSSRAPCDPVSQSPGSSCGCRPRSGRTGQRGDSRPACLQYGRCRAVRLAGAAAGHSSISEQGV